MKSFPAVVAMLIVLPVGMSADRENDDPTAQLPSCTKHVGPVKSMREESSCRTFCRVPDEEEQDNFTTRYAVAAQGWYSVKVTMDCSYYDTDGEPWHHTASCGFKQGACYDEHSGWMKDSGTVGAFRTLCEGSAKGGYIPPWGFWVNFEFACANLGHFPICNQCNENSRQTVDIEFIDAARPGDTICRGQTCVETLPNATSVRVAHNDVLGIACDYTCAQVPVECMRHDDIQTCKTTQSVRIERGA